MFLDKLAKDYEGRDIVDVITWGVNWEDDTMLGISVSSVLYDENYTIQEIAADNVDDRTVREVLEGWAEVKAKRKHGRGYYVDRVEIIPHAPLTPQELDDIITEYPDIISDHLLPVLFSPTEKVEHYRLLDVICDRLDELEKRGE